MIVLDIIVVLLILSLGSKYKNRFVDLDKNDHHILNKLFYYHIFFSLVFFAYVSTYGGDATNYWYLTYFDTLDFNDVLDLTAQGSVTGYMLLLNHIPAKVLQLHFVTGNIFYGFLGYMTFVHLYVILKRRLGSFEILQKIKVLGVSVFPTVLFLPNLHFWTSGVGKDTLIFFCMGLMFLGVNNIKKNIPALIVAVTLSLIIRPHITLFLIMAIGGGFLLDGNLKTIQKVFFTLIFAVSFVFVIQSAQQFANIENFEAETISQYADKQASHLSAERVGSAVDVSSYPFPLKVFTFLFRPFFIDGFSPLSLVASFENLFLLVLFLKTMPISMGGFKRGDFTIKGLLIFFILGTIAFSLILGNLGIMMRQKTPFIMALIVFVLFSHHNAHVRKMIW